METRDVVGRMAASSSSREIIPFVCTGRYVISKPSSESFLHESRTHLCSCSRLFIRNRTGNNRKKLTVCVVMTWFFFSLWKRATPLMDMLLVSVAPDVNTRSFASAPIRSAMFYPSTKGMVASSSFIKSSPFWRLRPPVQPPIRTHASCCEDCHTDQWGMEAWHPALEGPLELSPMIFVQHFAMAQVVWTNERTCISR